MDRFGLIKKEIEEILPNSPIVEESKHAELVLKWVLELKPDADEALKIAALSHDIDRAVNKITEKDLKDHSNMSKFKKEHSMRSAIIICNILKKHNYPQKIIGKVKQLVENHEVGGDPESDILKDADSIAYFEYNIPFYLKRYARERTKEKIKFMYERMSEKAKRLVHQIKFENKEIENMFEETVREL